MFEHIERVNVYINEDENFKYEYLIGLEMIKSLS